MYLVPYIKSMTLGAKAAFVISKSLLSLVFFISFMYLLYKGGTAITAFATMDRRMSQDWIEPQDDRHISRNVQDIIMRHRVGLFSKSLSLPLCIIILIYHLSFMLSCCYGWFSWIWNLLE